MLNKSKISTPNTDSANMTYSFYGKGDITNCRNKLSSCGAGMEQVISRCCGCYVCEPVKEQMGQVLAKIWALKAWLNQPTIRQVQVNTGVCIPCQHSLVSVDNTVRHKCKFNTKIICCNTANKKQLELYLQNMVDLHGIIHCPVP